MYEPCNLSPQSIKEMIQCYLQLGGVTLIFNLKIYKYVILFCSTVFVKLCILLTHISKRTKAKKKRKTKAPKDEKDTTKMGFGIIVFF